ncbi:hypothetical protein SAMN05216526_0888 [Ectothiorhodosinus mongolicus]|uniref:Uncharacterized protein n=1 Tax=Ectothiorhodosinus mongolicus TaxID=233100 RepID=A0A1R3VUK1_9GAMM|nr:DUF6489 family protein [Ectothiorhodosinus mongolicus]ULX56840.1 hypothetical protein CKX93_03455 [Ectothiorhodosinus mongolicus]SIT68588.1 hypothetical protein SAMN05216526_0888 [Ectothiorhodosinus mongolicus]
MKINISVDATPQEVRTFLGLPDLEPLQKEWLDDLSKRMREGQPGYEAMALMQPIMQGGMANMEAMQKVFWNAMSQAGEKGEDKS